MSMTIAKIVAGYVKVENRRALSDLLAHRRKVLAELQGDIGHQSGNAVRAVQDELRRSKRTRTNSNRRLARCRRMNGASVCALIRSHGIKSAGEPSRGDTGAFLDFSPSPKRISTCGHGTLKQRSP